MIFLSSITSQFLGKIIKCYIKVKATEFSTNTMKRKKKRWKMCGVFVFPVTAKKTAKYNNNNKKPKCTFSLISCKHFLAWKSQWNPVFLLTVHRAAAAEIFNTQFLLLLMFFQHIFIGFYWLFFCFLACVQLLQKQHNIMI